MTKIRGGRSLLDDLRAVHDQVREAGHTNIEHATVVRLTEETGRDLLDIARELDRLIVLLDPLLDRVQQRANARDLLTVKQQLHEHERRMAALEARVTQLDLERRGVTPFPERKQERG